MNNIAIREMTKEETPLLIKWLYERRKVNLVNLEPFRKNQVRIYVASDETGILAFIPIQFVYRYDALATRPGLPSISVSKVCQEMTKFIKEKAEEENIGEIWVQPSDETFSEFLQNLGYGRVERETLCMNFDAEKGKKIIVEAGKTGVN